MAENRYTLYYNRTDLGVEMAHGTKSDSVAPQRSVSM